MRGVLFAFGWVATVAAAFVLGKTMGAERPDAEPGDVLERAGDADERVDPGPMLAPGAPANAASGGSAAESATSGGSAARATEEVVGETLEPFTLEGVTDPDVAMARLMRHVTALLAKGQDGHLDLLKFLDENVVDNDALERMFDSEEQAVRYIVPWIEFMVHRKAQVVGVIESVFETMAESPEQYAELDDDTLEIFTEGAAFILPGAVDEARLATFRDHARAVLATPEGSLPEPVERQRRRIQQALMLWAPRLSAEDALARLKSGALQGAEAVQVLRGLPPEQLADLDLGALLEPVVAQMDYRTMRALEDIPLQPRDVDLLDRTLLTAAAAGKARDWVVVQYLAATKRGKWPQQQGLLEEGLRRGGAAMETCALAIARLGRAVPADYCRWVLDTYELSKNAATRLENRANSK